MFLSFIIYGLSALSLYILGKNVSMRENYQLRLNGQTLSFTSVEIVLSILLFAVICGARYNTGIDYPTYLKEYLRLQVTGNMLRDDVEPGFVLISRYFSNLGFHYFFFFAFWGAMQILFTILR